MKMRFSSNQLVFGLLFTPSEYDLAIQILRSLQGDTLKDHAVLDQTCLTLAERYQPETEPPKPFLTLIKGGKDGS